MFNKSKGKATIALVLIAFVFASTYPYVADVKAQNQATVNVFEATDGSIDPTPGTYNYNDGSGVVLTATPDANFVFANWIISTDASNDTATDNPHTLTVTGGVTYNVSAVFTSLFEEPTPSAPTYPTPTNPSPYGVVAILHAIGGHTTPAEGAYYFSSGFPVKLTAIANSGWKFDHWVISGDTSTTHGGYPFTLTPTDNPYTTTCGVGYTYAFQPVFVPVSSAPPSTTSGGISTELTIIIVVVIVIIAVVSAIIGYSLAKRRK